MRSVTELVENDCAVNVFLSTSRGRPPQLAGDRGTIDGDRWHADVQEDPEYVLKFQSDDVKRVMGSLNTSAATAAFNSGGGGAKAQVSSAKP